MFQKIIFSILLFVANMQTLKALVYLNSLESQSSKEETKMSFKFSAKEDFEAIQFENAETYLFFKLPQTTNAIAHQFVDANSPFLRKIGLYQKEPGLLEVRLYPSTDAAKILAALKFKFIDQKLILTLDHQIVENTAVTPFTGTKENATTTQPTVEQKPVTQILSVKNESLSKEPLSLAPVSELTLSKEQMNDLMPVDEALKNIEVKEEKTAPSVMIKNSDDEAIAQVLAKDNANKSAKSSLVSYQPYLQKLALVGAIFMGIAFAFLMIKRKKSSRLNSQKLEASLKTIASVHLGPKHKVSLLDVNGQQILVGLTADNIHFHSLPIQNLAAKYLNKPTSENFDDTFSKTSLSEASTKNRIAPPVKNVMPKELSMQTPTQQQTSGIERKKNFPKIKVSIDDDGIHELDTKDEKIKDFSRLIKEKLKNFPK